MIHTEKFTIDITSVGLTQIKAVQMNTQGADHLGWHGTEWHSCFVCLLFGVSL